MKHLFSQYVGVNSNTECWTLVPIAFTNAGIIRVGLNKGKITFDDLATSHPYENTVDTFEIKGEYLLEALEISASKYGTVDFLQFSGKTILCLIYVLYSILFIIL